MKKLIFILMLLPFVAIGQNRFEKLFTEADRAFYEEAKKAAVDAAMKTDSVFSTRSFYNCVWDSDISSDKRKNILVSECDYLSEYMNGYMIGQLSYYYNKSFNYDILERKLKKIKSELRKTSNYNCENTPESVMAKYFETLNQARKLLEQAETLYKQRDNDCKGDKFNAINCRKSILHLAHAYDEVSAIKENDIDN